MFEIIKEEAFRREPSFLAGRAFLFFGEEDYLKAAAVRGVREVLCPDPAMAFFNDITIDATDYTPDKLLDAMAPPPMMTDVRLILLRGFDFTTMKASDADILIEVLGELEEYDFNCIIIQTAAGLFDEGYLPRRPSPMLKRLQAVATPVQFDAPTGARLARWVGKHFAHYGVAADPTVCNDLIAYAGKTMFVLANEIQKLAAFVKENGGNTVTVADIKRVAVPASLPDAFALSNAILAGNGQAALEALAVMKFERVEPTVILGEISGIFSNMQSMRVLLDAGKSIKEVAAIYKMHEYKAGLLAKAAMRTSPQRLRHVIALAAETDLALKHSYGDYAPLEKLICAL